ncbi:MAG TPA: ParB N-terminal domain-containing protein [Thermoplasmata archaeon]|nr:ParB N-terminal domain-containing protein [Thermoplasmata archaeon]
MSAGARFAMVPTARLRAHEEVDPVKVEALVGEIRERGSVDEPILIAAGSDVILNGHHRFAALRRLGARRVPVWIVAYEDERIRLERWSEGPRITKAEIVEHGRRGELYPPKTSRHVIGFELPERPTPLAEIVGAAANGRPTNRARRGARGAAIAPRGE